MARIESPKQAPDATSMLKNLLPYLLFFQAAVLWAAPASEFEKIVAPDTDAGDTLGASIAVDGNVMIVGAPNEESGGFSRGAAYIYVLSAGNTWDFQTKLIAPNNANSDKFGESVSVSGNMVIVGATGHKVGGVGTGAAFVYAHTSGNTWIEQAELVASDGLSGDRFGISVAINGNVAIVGASWHDAGGFSNSGASYIYANPSGNIWVEQMKVFGTPSYTNRYYGQSVAIQGNVAMVGSYRDNYAASQGGAVYVYANTSANIWTEQTVITQSDVVSNDELGDSISLSGNLLLAGAPGDDVEGAAYIFANTSGNIWVELAKIEPSDGVSQDNFGTAVSLSGNMAVIGALDQDALGSNSGAAYTFLSSSPSVWVEQDKLVAGDGKIEAHFGTAVGISGNLVVVGAPSDSSLGTDAGAAYTFDLESLDHAPVITPTPSLDVTFPPSQNFLTIGSGNIVVSDVDGDALTWTVVGQPAHGNITSFGFTGNQINVLTYQSNFAEPVGDTFVLEVDDGKFSREIVVSVGVEFTDFESVYAIDSLPSLSFGYSIDTDGRFMIIGTVGDSTLATQAGAAYIYARSGNSWVFQDKVFASDAEASDGFGHDVSISGNLAIVGAPNEDTGGSNAGAAYAFVNTSGNNWVEQTKLVSDAPAANNKFGENVSISGNQAIVSSHNDAALGTLAGAAFIFANTSGNNWVQQIRIAGSDTDSYDYFGTGVSISGNQVLVGARGKPAAYVFVNAGGNMWFEEAKLQNINDPSTEQFGMHVALSGNVAVVTAPIYDDIATNGGGGFVYTKDQGGTWAQQAILVASDSSDGDMLGETVSVSGDKILIGTKSKNSSAGGAYLFTYAGGGVWVEESRLTDPGTASFDNFGYDVSIYGNLALVGVISDDTAASNSGALKVFELDIIDPEIVSYLREPLTLPEGGSLTLDSTDLEAWSYYSTALTWSLSSNAVNGAITSFSTSGNLLNSLVYEPNPGYSGSDSFILQVDDAAGGVTFQRISVYVYPTPLDVLQLDPFNGETDFPVDGNLMITFYENVDLATGNIQIYQDNVMTHDIVVTSQSNVGPTVDFDISPDLNFGALVDVIIPPGLISGNVSGNSFPGFTTPGEWSFTTENIVEGLSFGVGPAVEPSDFTEGDVDVPLLDNRFQLINGSIYEEITGIRIDFQQGIIGSDIDNLKIGLGGNILGELNMGGSTFAENLSLSIPITGTTDLVIYGEILSGSAGGNLEYTLSSSDIVLANGNLMQAPATTNSNMGPIVPPAPDFYITNTGFMAPSSMVEGVDWPVVEFVLEPYMSEILNEVNVSITMGDGLDLASADLFWIEGNTVIGTSGTISNSGFGFNGLSYSLSGGTNVTLQVLVEPVLTPSMGNIQFFITPSDIVVGSNLMVGGDNIDSGSIDLLPGGNLVLQPELGFTPPSSIPTGNSSNLLSFDIYSSANTVFDFIEFDLVSGDPADLGDMELWSTSFGDYFLSNGVLSGNTVTFSGNGTVLFPSDNLNFQVRINLPQSPMGSSLELVTDPMDSAMLSFGGGSYNTFGLIFGTGNISFSLPNSSSENIQFPQQSIAGGRATAAVIPLGSAPMTSGRNDLGQLGRSGDSSIFDPISGLVGAVGIVSGETHSLALMADGNVFSWGYSDYGQSLGGSPQLETGLMSPVLYLAAGAHTSFAITDSNELWAKGRNHKGQLGLGDTADRSSWTQVTVLPAGNVLAVSAGVEHTLVLIDGKVCGFGSDGFGQLNQSGGEYLTCVYVEASPVWTRIEAGGFHSLMEHQMGDLYGCGKNDRGQLGLGHNTSVVQPPQSIALPGNVDGILDFAAGFDHSVVMVDDMGSTRIVATGSNRDSQLSISGIIETLNFQNIDNVITNGIEVDAGPHSTLILDSSPILMGTGIIGDQKREGLELLIDLSP